MRPVIVTAFVSTDGVMEEPRWTFEVVEYDEAAYEIKDREQKEASALLLGRRTYEEFAPVWPTMDEFAEYNTMPRYVVSTSMEKDNPEWPATILPTLDHVAALNETEGGPMFVHGSAELGANLADAGLVDRYHLLVFPVLLGAGKRLFSTSEKELTKLDLVEHEAYSNGIIKQVYDVVR
jgi:dihydrofolate reductase